MKKPIEQFEWHYLDNQSGEKAWAQYVAGVQVTSTLSANPDAGATNWVYNRQLRNFLLPLSILLCLLAAGASYWLWQSAQTGLEKIRQEIQLAAAADFGACMETVITARNRPRLDAQATNEPPRSLPPLADYCLPWQQVMTNFPMQAARQTQTQTDLHLTVEKIELVEPFALASVHVAATDAATAFDYRGALVFQQVAGAWRYRTQNSDVVWGAPRTSSSPLLQIEFHERDAAEITDMVDALNQQVAAWRTAFGLAAVPAQPITIRSSTVVEAPDEDFRANAPTTGVNPTSDVVPDIVTLPSPQLLMRPADQSASAAFEARVSRLLLLKVMDEALGNADAVDAQSIPEQWRIMVSGFYGALASAAPVVESHQQVEALDLSLALITFGPATKQTVFNSNDSNETKRSWIVFSRPSLDDPGKYWAAESVAEYILKSYGPEKMIAMLKAVPRHASWETLVPDVFGLNAPTFQAAWRAYIVENYLPREN